LPIETGTVKAPFSIFNCQFQLNCAYQEREVGALRPYLSPSLAGVESGTVLINYE
jgi:hypothetical protein